MLRSHYRMMSASELNSREAAVSLNILPQWTGSCLSPRFYFTKRQKLRKMNHHPRLRTERQPAKRIPGDWLWLIATVREEVSLIRSPWRPVRLCLAFVGGGNHHPVLVARSLRAKEFAGLWLTGQEGATT